MRPGDDSHEPANELRVTDKRRFSADGNIRDEGAAEAEQSAPAPEAPVPARAAEPPAAAPASDAASDRQPQGVYDLGIEAVFYVFYQSALIALGASQPGAPPGRVDLAEARQAITFLQVLEQKTRGNLSADEQATLRELLSEAQMAYVQVARSVGSPA